MTVSGPLDVISPSPPGSDSATRRSQRREGTRLHPACVSELVLTDVRFAALAVNHHHPGALLEKG